MHNRLILIASDIPDSVAELNPLFYEGVFNENKTKRQLDGYAIDENENVIQPPKLVHMSGILLYWCRGEKDPQAAVDKLLSSGYQLKPSEYILMRSDPTSEWYIKSEGII